MPTPPPPPPTLIDDSRSDQTNASKYDAIRTYRLADGKTVRVRFHRDPYETQSHAVAEALTPALTWTHIASHYATDWWPAFPSGRDNEMARRHSVVMIANRLVERAALILAGA